jgi:hypothetical protein
MLKLGFFASIATILGTLAFASLTAEPADAEGTACVHKDLKTDLIKQACEKGGQQEAKTAMKAFMKEKKIKSCNECHAKLSPSYDLKPNGLDQFTKAGGK